MSFYVKRSNDEREGWIGPIRSAQQAERERAAWVDAGWSAEVVESTPKVRATVAEWVRATRARRAS